MKELNTTGKRIRHLREARGWTQAELAIRLRALGTAGSTPRLSKVETGAGEATVEYTRALALVLGTSTDYLLLLSDSPEKRANGETVQQAVGSGGPRQ